ncbi:MAG: hypothetical protein CVU47_04610 [Chloroflexi bacterium HGW-Chloroflexi-9]|nr:MAG: hypothetical protein CVU47_04610 [Chloroflexi bacterium HGW-Chloroflexi-9]
MTTEDPQGSPPPLPPSTNRGAEITDGGVSIDWLEFSVQQPVEEVRARLSTWGPESWLALERGALGYRHMEISTRAIELLWDEDRPEVHVRLRGVACGLMTEAGTLALVEWVTSQGVGAGFSRLDLQATVPYAIASVEDVRAAFDRGEGVTHARRGFQQGGFPLTGHASGAAGDGVFGRTLYIGAPTSRRRLRVYDKGAESAGLIPGTRFELQERDAAADEAAAQLVVAGVIAPVMAGRLVGFVDFRVGEGMVTRRTRAPWYAAMVGEVERLRSYPPAGERTAAEVAEWLRRQTGPSLAALAARGELDIAFLLEDGRRRWTVKHERLIQDAS